MPRTYYVYILASGRNGTLYTGVTSTLTRRLEQHLTGEAEAFTQRYGVRYLVWFEACDSIEAAIAHEKRLKRWRRRWKLELIESLNPDWRDLSEDLT
jgi:putative endonuclease